METENRTSLGQLLGFFLVMGLTAFGGPIAHLAILEREAISKRGWMTREEFLDVMGLLNLIPGPNSTQMVMYFGYRQRGVPGMLAAGLGFIFPAFSITLAVTWLYILYGNLPQGQALLMGIQPVVVAIIFSALWKFIPKGVTGWKTGAIFALALIAAILGINEAIIILSAGAIAWLGGRTPIGGKTLSLFPIGLISLQFISKMSPNLPNIFAVYTKMGITLYGTGYLLVAYMQGNLVDALGWLTNQQLIDAIAIGQMTPGPFLTTAASTGMLIAGVPGAVVATTAIFLPSFFLVGVFAGKVELLRSSDWGKLVLKGVNAAVVAVLLVVAVTFSLEVTQSPIRFAIMALAFIALERYKVNSMLLVAIGGVIGVLTQLVF